MLLDTIDYLSAQIEKLSVRITTAITELPGPDSDDSGGGSSRPGPSLVERLDEIPGVGPAAAQVLLAEVGTDMSVFPSPAHLASWAKLTPRTVQSGPKTSARGTGKGNPWLKGVLGEAALAASRTDTFLGARYRRLVKRRGHKKALVAVARSILVIAWHLIHDPTTRFTELGADHHQRRIDPERKTHDLVRQLKTLGHNVILTSAEQAV
jgi:transposase